MRFAFLGLHVACVCVSGLFAQIPSKLYQAWLDNPQGSLLPDFSYAGRAWGEQTVPSVPSTLPLFKVADYGAVVNDGKDDRLQIQAAIDAAACGGGGIVQLEKGTYQVNSLVNGNADDQALWIRSSNIILRGAGSGSDGTIIYSPNEYSFEYGPYGLTSMLQTAPRISKGQQLNYGYGAALPEYLDWYSTNSPGASDREEFYYRVKWRVYPEDHLAWATADGRRKTNSLNVDKPGSFKPGQIVMVVLKNVNAREKLIGPWDWRQFYFFDPVINIGIGADEASYVRQIMTVSSITGNTITFKEKFHYDFETRYKVEIARFPYIENIGIEDMRFEIKDFDKTTIHYSPGSGIKFVNTVNGWAKNVSFHNLGGAIIFATSKDCVADNCMHTGQATHSSFGFIFSTNCLMQKCRIDNIADHSFAAMEEAIGNVYLDCVGRRDASFDPHSNLPLANLWDRTTGPIGPKGGPDGHMAGGNRWTEPHHGPYATWWNTNAVTTLGSYQWDVWQGYGEFQIQLVKPIIAGYRGNIPLSVQFVTNNTFFEDSRVAAEGVNNTVTPSSLYLAQLAHRLGRNPEPGIVIITTGPTRLVAGKSYSWSAAKSVAGSALSFEWFVDGTRVSGEPSISRSFDTAGKHTIRVTGTSATGGSMSKTFDVWVSAPRGVIVDMQQDPTPLSTNLIDAGFLWHLVEYNHGSWFTVPWISGTDFGFKARVQSSDWVGYGGHIYTDLPDEGIDITSARYAINVSTGIGGTLNLLVRDSNNIWAMSNTLPFDGASGAVSALRWEAPYPELKLQYSTSFDATRATKVGIVAFNPRKQWAAYKVLYNFKDFALTGNQATRINGDVNSIQRLVDHPPVEIFNLNGRLVRMQKGANRIDRGPSPGIHGVYLMRTRRVEARVIRKSVTMR